MSRTIRFLLGTIETLMLRFIKSTVIKAWQIDICSFLVNRDKEAYFMQCLLLEASQQGIPNIVIDYTEGFYQSVRREFTDTLGDKIHHKLFIMIIFNQSFKPNMRDIGGIQLLETATDVNG